MKFKISISYFNIKLYINHTENVSDEIWSSLKKTPVQDRDFQLWFKTVEKKYPLRKF